MHIKSTSDNRIRLESEKHEASVSLNWNNENKKWLLTAYEKETSPNSKTTNTTISNKPEEGDTALSSDNVSSTGKDTANNSNGQEINTNKTDELKPATKTPAEMLAEAGGDILKMAQTVAKQAEIAKAEKQVDTNPTEGQKEAGNYRKGHVKIHGFDISIEQPKGSVRSGMDENGRAWESEMHNTYGYFRGTEGKDRGHIDVFLGENPLSENVFVVDQVNPETGEFDEHKVMMGFNTVKEAREAYLSNYEKDWKGLGGIAEVNIDDFRDWAKMEGRRIKPFMEYILYSVVN